MEMSFLTIGEKYTRPELARRRGYESHHAIARGVVTPQGREGHHPLRHAPQAGDADAVSGLSQRGAAVLGGPGEARHRRPGHRRREGRRRDPPVLPGGSPQPVRVQGQGHPAQRDPQDRRAEPVRLSARTRPGRGRRPGAVQGEIESIPEVTEREEVRKARVGQGRFRKLLLDLWGARCAVPGWRCRPSSWRRTSSPGAARATPSVWTLTTAC